MRKLLHRWLIWRKVGARSQIECIACLVVQTPENFYESCPEAEMKEAKRIRIGG